MSGIREQIDSHTLRVRAYGGFVVFTPEEAQELIDLAHEAVHPEPQVGGTSDDQSEDKPSPSKLSVEEETNLRQVALAYATSIDTARIAAAHGLETEKVDIVGTAEAILVFLKGGL